MVSSLMTKGFQQSQTSLVGREFTSTQATSYMEQTDSETLKRGRGTAIASRGGRHVSTIQEAKVKRMVDHGRWGILRFREDGQTGTKGEGDVGVGVGGDMMSSRPRVGQSRAASEVSTGRPQVCIASRLQFSQLHTMLARTTRPSFAAASKQAYICQSCTRQARRSELGVLRLAPLHTIRHVPTGTPSFRKTLKDAAKQQKKKKQNVTPNNVLDEATGERDRRAEEWELTVGIEVHAELNTARKLFSKAATSIGDAPNTHAALFDVAFPGSQPIFQQETLVPALRAAIAFQCEIPRQSSFDRKHYFYQDQPNGYQITQYYEPFAKNGKLTLCSHDYPPGQGLIHIGIKQIQMEQDTAKTVQQPPSTHLLDFNRVSHPLIEIITMPEIHDPSVAAAVVRKIQHTLKSVDACTTGMELGGLRADVNVSVRRREGSSKEASHSYHGATGLGQRTEIKNLSSVKAVEDAIIAERDRQIDILESGGIIQGETRGWTLGSQTTKRLRSKEGEVDYRYMPDPDIAPIVIADVSTLAAFVSSSMLTSFRSSSTTFEKHYQRFPTRSYLT